ncbi:NnrU family protein [Meridianimarinicoccus roseus]|uniref:NnrU family protein n=1 Tax=Meridianimarinicoccus roseus TaxID=2072018 RepID=A0A2V2LH85_9RHOB|nr:NnrU family protein [Meridianimarinicoccus roseus]PWR03351.1 NnrU family protein [Meridianimarinicoccus roseus]
MGWTGFAAVFAVFFLTHSIPVRPAVKSRLVGTIGLRGFGVAYSLLSLGMLALLIWSAGEAPYVQLWPQMEWYRHAAHLGMLAVCLILALSIGRPNPFCFGGVRNDRFDPTQPGIVRWTRHPVLLALAIWAGVHLLPNGNLAHVILFGVLGSFALAGRTLIDRRKRRLLGASRWDALDTARKAAPPFYAPGSWRILFLKLLTGLAAFATLLLAHPYLIGVSAL